MAEPKCHKFCVGFFYLLSGAILLFASGFYAGHTLMRQALKPDACTASNQLSATGRENQVKNLETDPQIDTKDFSSVAKTLDSGDKVAEYLRNGFTISGDENGTALEPAIFFADKSGGAHDAAVFAAYVLKNNGYEAGVIKYAWTENNRRKTHAVAVFRDNDLPKYLSADSGNVAVIAHGWSFNDLLAKEEERTGVKIDEYAYFAPGQIDLDSGDWIDR